MDLQNTPTVCSQPSWLLTRSKRFLPQAPQLQSTEGWAPRFPCANRKAAQRQGMCYPRVRPHSRSGLTAARCSCSGLVQGEGTHVTGAGCSQQHLQGAFYTNLFLYKVVKKKKKKKPLTVVHTEVWDSIGFGWVIDFKSQQHMLFSLAFSFSSESASTIQRN